MLNWFYKWLGNKILTVHESEKEDSQPINLITAKPHRGTRVREDGLVSNPIQFKMFKASGGWAVEFKQYDNKSDNVDSHLYVIKDEEELGKSLSHIITMEALKR